MPPSSTTNDLFRRHSRPQPPIIPGVSPTVQGLQPFSTRPQPIPVRRTPSWVPSEKQSYSRNQRFEPPGSPIPKNWADFDPKYELIQGNSRFVVSKLCDSSDAQVIFKKGCISSRLPARHNNILPIQYTINQSGIMFFGYEDALCTLEEILTVTAPLNESHIRLIAQSVFDAIQHLYTNGLSHGRLTSSTIRLCSKDARVAISDIDECVKKTTESVTKDLEALGLILVDCMELKSRRTELDPNKIRACRKHNQVFGLSNAEQWSGSKHLVDFVDNLFSGDPQGMLKRRHDFISSVTKDPEIMRPLIELTQLSCFRLEQPIEMRELVRPDQDSAGQRR